MSLSYDDLAHMLARQILGSDESDNVAWATQAMDLSLDKLQQRANLISQEKKGNFTSTGANEYEWNGSVISQSKFFRAVKFYTAYGVLSTPSHQLFVTTHPDYRSANTGIAQYAVQWELNKLLIWPDQAGDVIYYTFYELLDQNKSERVLSVVYDLARHYLENDAETRALNWSIAKDSIRDAERANDHVVGQTVDFLPEERVARLNHWKSRRGRR